MKHTNILNHGLRLTAAVALLLAGLLGNAAAQEKYYYTLTNGTQKWLIKSSGDPDAVPIETEVQAYGYGITTPAGVGNDTTLLLNEGTVYLELDITDPEHPTVRATTTFSPKCVWIRSSQTTGDYRQEWDGYKYFLNATTTEIIVRRYPIGEASNTSTEWYDWDFGTALTEYYGTSARYHWIVLGTDDNTWKMSLHSYERPEELVCNSIDCDPLKQYYAEYSNPVQYAATCPTCTPTGTTAQFMPVQIIDHDAEITSGDVAEGLTQITVGGTVGYGAGATTIDIAYGDTPKAVALAYTNGNVQLRPAYKEYVETTELRDVALDWKNRSLPNGWGTATTTPHYYSTDGDELGGIPSAAASQIGESKVTGVSYSINKRARRYLKVYDDGGTWKVQCFSRPPDGTVDTLTVTVHYDNGASQSRKVAIRPSYTETPVTYSADNAPYVKGAVFGGGRMADVEGNTNVYLHKTDYLAAAFGGNDIAGQVTGKGTVRVGTLHSDTLYVEEVYGGGNGYYHYASGIAGTYATPTETTVSGAVTPLDGSEVLATLATGSKVPLIAQTEVVIGRGIDALANAKVRVGTAFGGAKNAFVGESAAVTMDDGTAMSIFGGNNYGGGIDDAATVDVTVNGTDLSTDVDILNDYFTGYGIDYGVRYLYGGGNKVDAPTVQVTFNGGMVDTAYAGGNEASVTVAATATANCTDTKKIYENSYADLDIDHWVGGHGRYNVRTLFGGNNKAPMAIVPQLELTAGGLGTVFGGGNHGNMTGSKALTSAETTKFEKDQSTVIPAGWGTMVEMNGAAVDIDYLYGGCNMSDVEQATYVNLTAGNVGTVFGGCNISGDVAQGTYVSLDGTAVVKSRLFGGSNGYYHCNNNTNYVEGIDFTDNAVPANLFDPYDDYLGIAIPTHNMTTVVIDGGTVNGNVYGGANLTNVGDDVLKNGSVHLSMNGGTVEGTMYGGGNMASIYGLSYISVTGGTIGTLYAGNDRVGRIENFGSYTTRTIAAEDFVSSDGTKLNGPDGAIYSAYVKLTGTPEIGEVYGGGNGDYDYTAMQLCDTTKPSQESSYIDINTDGNNIATVYGGGNGVGVRSEVTVLLNSTGTATVGTIFGGNNKDDMNNCVPLVKLEKGKVTDVYGGGNHGDMGGTKTVEDICGKKVDVATYVLVNSSSAEVEGDIYGGCNMADVDGMTFVDIRETTPTGVNYVYGGNNIGGKVDKARVDVTGGTVNHIYGGSNGYYDYKHLSGNDITVYNFGHYDDAEYQVAEHLHAETFVSATFVNILGGTIKNSVFGGGRMGNVDSTHVVVDDRICGGSETRGSTIEGTVYGGGEGNMDEIKRHFKEVEGQWAIVERRGNVMGWTDVQLIHAGNVTSAKAYGGGLGGDVFNTSITLHDTWDQPMDEIYGGCWGSDVIGNTYITLNGLTPEGGKHTVGTVYGGNDRTGNVNGTNITINSGTYNYVYGGGNGSEPYPGCPAPNNEQAVVNMNDGKVTYNIYGGGRMGTTMRTEKDENGEMKAYRVATNDVPTEGQVSDAYLKYDTTWTVAEAHGDPKDYSYIIVNMRGGYVGSNIYAGAAGSSENPKRLVYGLKVLNMDGNSRVGESIYGGSESVSDGYWSECLSSHRDGAGKLDNTTLRPSSIINMAGGTLGNNIYGAGYLGVTHGSTYINVGTEAIKNCVAYGYTIAGQDSAYAIFQPGHAGSLSPTLNPGYLRVTQSIYGGANWGQGSGQSSFSTEGYHGGESRILVDGKGYVTWDDGDDDISIDIKKSIIGTGTSALSGDVLTRIDILNYGRKGDDCHATRTLESVQRTDSLVLHNTAIRYTGANNAAVLYDNNSFSINLADSIICIGYNLIDLDAQVMGVKYLKYYEDDGVTEVDNESLTTISNTAEACTTDFCKRITVIDPNEATKKHTAWVVNRGYEVDLMYIDESDAQRYAEVYGYGYLLAEDKVNACVIARWKVPGSTNVDDGGFVAACRDSNYTGAPGAWVHNTGYVDDAEYAYSNYSSTYRKWDIGTGVRRRSTNIVAYTDLTRSDDCKAVIVSTPAHTKHQMGVATAKLMLPPATAGHYYKIAPTGIEIHSDNGTIGLTDSTYDVSTEAAWASLDNEWYNYEEGEGTESQGSWLHLPTSAFSGLNAIYREPNTVFGLMMRCGQYFSGTMPSTHSGAQDYTVIPGDAHVAQTGNFCTSTVQNGQNDALPTMDLYMLYDSKRITNTTMGTVTFTLYEYFVDGDGVEHEMTDEPIEVTVQMQTIIEKFVDMECEVLAMYNEGRTNTFSRRVVLPATLQHRELYMTSIKWEPTDENGASLNASDVEAHNLFYLVDDNPLIGDDNSRFTMDIMPNDNLSSSLAAVLGWHSKGDTLIHLYDAAERDDHVSKVSALNAGGLAVEYDLTKGGTSKGRKMGELDGRGMAVIDVNMGFNGELIYPEREGKGYVGKVTIGMQSYVGSIASESAPFTLTIYLKVRKNGDTIYVASAESMDFYLQSDMSGTPVYTKTTYGPCQEGNDEEGKWPHLYVQTLQRALNRDIYVEGDVIALIGPVDVNTSFSIAGNDYYNVPIIRYDGHHHELPGDDFIPRGTLINITDGNSMAAYAIDFDGSAFAKTISSVTYDASKNHLTSIGEVKNDTTIAHGPFVKVDKGGTFVLANGSTMRNNFNDVLPTADADQGTIHVEGTLEMMGNITIENNVNNNYGFSAVKPLTGAVYVKDGNVQIAASSLSSKMTITDNYLIAATPTNYFENYPAGSTDSEARRLVFKDTYLADLQKANVYLTRTVGTGDPELSDQITDHIVSLAEMPEDTRIGVSKWFPGPDSRDTINIVYAKDRTYLNPDNFLSDVDEYTVFYNAGVNNQLIYLHRCATFKPQAASLAALYADSPAKGKGIEYVYDEKALCPKGEDSIIFRVREGLLPYTYEWTVNGDAYGSKRKTNGTDKEITTEVNAGNYVRLEAAQADSLRTPMALTNPHEAETTMVYLAKATDVAGCVVQRLVNVKMEKVTTTPNTYKETNADYTFPATSEYADRWTSTDDSTAVYVLRQFQAIKVQPRVLAKSDAGIIDALVGADGSTNPNIYSTAEGSEYLLSDLNFCAGDSIILNTHLTDPADERYKFLMWDFDPYYSPLATYIVPSNAGTNYVTAYYGPKDYWIDVVDNTTKAKAILDENYYYTTRANAGDADAGYVTTYNDDVHIYNENGLAWFISVVNGLNGTQAREFYFNNVYLHKKSDGTAYDMKDHLWTPVGTPQHPFRGYFIGVDNTSDSCTTPLAENQYVVVENIIVNEPEMDYTAMFGHIDSARIMSINLKSAFIHGSQYVAAMAADSRNAKIANCKIEDESEDASATILTTHYTSGGLVAKSYKDILDRNISVGAKYVGDAVYSGGIVGYGESTQAINSYARNDIRMNGLYIGGIAGYMDGTAPYTGGIFRRKSNGALAEISNNYIRTDNYGKPERVGGVVGYAKNTVIENNYVYGDLSASTVSGAVAAVADQGTHADYNYYETGSTDRKVGQQRTGASVATTVAFDGKGNQVMLAESAYGVDNMTRALNRWVRDHADGDYLTWRSDLEGVNNGYPIFGTPDLIPVNNVMAMHGCDSIVYEGQYYNDGDSLTVHVIDSVEMIDSTSTLLFYVGHSTHESHADTGHVGQPYTGYGFYLSPTETELLRQTLDAEGRATIVLSDTLSTTTGCDSIVTLTLTFFGNNDIPEVIEEPSAADIHVYPNPTTSVVNVEADGLQHVELYDNEGRTLADYTTNDGHRVTFDVFDLSSGIYYLRVYAAGNVTIQKLIKK